MKVEEILNILWSIKDKDKFYFDTYGKELLEEHKQSSTNEGRDVANKFYDYLYSNNKAMFKHTKKVIINGFNKTLSQLPKGTNNLKEIIHKCYEMGYEDRDNDIGFGSDICYLNEMYLKDTNKTLFTGITIQEQMDKANVISDGLKGTVDKVTKK